jgi:hypothetical protein
MANADAIFKISVFSGKALCERHGAKKCPDTLIK